MFFSKFFKDEPKDDPRVYSAYEALVKVAVKKKVTKDEMGAAIEEAIGYLGEVLSE